MCETEVPRKQTSPSDPNSMERLKCLIHRCRNRFCGIVDIDEAFVEFFFCVIFSIFRETLWLLNETNQFVQEIPRNRFWAHSFRVFSESWATPSSQGDPGSHVVLDRMSFHTICNGAAQA